MACPAWVRPLEAILVGAPRVLVASAASDGTPHLTTAVGVRLVGEDSVSVTAWFCPETLANLEGNPAAAVVLAPPDGAGGLQLIGRVEGIEELAMLDGYRPGHEDPIVPQVQRRILLAVKRAFPFTDGPHLDEPLG